MVIKASSGKAVNDLIADLSSDEQTRSDAAIARLIVIGERAAQRLLDLASDHAAKPAARVAAFQALDAIGEPRVFEPAAAALGDDNPSIGVAAATVVRSFLHTRKGIAALDRLSEIAMDVHRPTAVRVAAVQALATLDSATVRPLVTSLAHDIDPAIAEAATGTPGVSASRHGNASQTLANAADLELPSDPDTLKNAITRAGHNIPVAVLLQIVERVRIREGAESGEVRAQWASVRGRAHTALAQRRSRLAIHDLRETIESAKTPVAIDFLSALMMIGDGPCLEAIAAAYAKAATTAASSEDWWRRSLADAFKAIVAREGITRRHAVARHIDKRWKGLFDVLAK